MIDTRLINITILPHYTFQYPLPVSYPVSRLQYHNYSTIIQFFLLQPFTPIQSDPICSIQANPFHLQLIHEFISLPSPRSNPNPPSTIQHLNLQFIIDHQTPNTKYPKYPHRHFPPSSTLFYFPPGLWNETRRNTALEALHRQHDYGQHWEVILFVIIPVSCLAVLILNCLMIIAINPAFLTLSLPLSCSPPFSFCFSPSHSLIHSISTSTSTSTLTSNSKVLLPCSLSLPANIVVIKRSMR